MCIDDSHKQYLRTVSKNKTFLLRLRAVPTLWVSQAAITCKCPTDGQLNFDSTNRQKR